MPLLLRSPDNATLLLARKVYGILFSFWKKFFDILVDGPALVEIANPNYLSNQQVLPFLLLELCGDRSNSDCELREDYENLLSVNPLLLNVLSCKPADEAAKLLTLGRDGFHNSEVHKISKAIPLWPTGYKIPTVRADCLATTTE
jgi:hypothetical protein